MISTLSQVKFTRKHLFCDLLKKTVYWLFGASIIFQGIATFTSSYLENNTIQNIHKKIIYLLQSHLCAKTSSMNCTLTVTNLLTQNSSDRACSMILFRLSLQLLLQSTSFSSDSFNLTFFGMRFLFSFLLSIVGKSLAWLSPIFLQAVTFS